MLIKKYKTLKSISTLSKLNNIIKDSSFLCFVQVKHLNHNEWLILKQIIHPFGLNVFVCKNTFLKSKNILFNLTKLFGCNLSHGNLVILYSSCKLTYTLSDKFFTVDLFLKKIKMSPLIFYFLNRFLFSKHFFNLCKTSKQQAFYNLISILEYHNYNILTNLISTNKLLLTNLNSIRL
jgi:hypothetical protein